MTATAKDLLNNNENVDGPLFKGGLIDWILFALAMISLGLLSWQNFFHVDSTDLLIIRVTDYSVCGIFAFEFFWSWYKEGWTFAYLKRNWYAVLGMIPVSHSILHYHPFVRAILVFFRFARAIDRILGQGFTFRLINRYKDKFIGAISGFVTLIVLERVADVLVKGTYTENIAKALADEQTQLREMVLEKLKSDPQTGKFSKLPYHDVIVENVINTILRVTESILQDQRTDELVADMLRVNIDQLREAIAEQEDERKEKRQLRKS